MSIILFLLVLTFLILIHELGHFFVAKWSQVKIEEFGIGLPPKALTLFTWKGIPFTFNWIFLGGFVRMEGEDTLGVDSGKLKVESKKQHSPLSTLHSPFPFYSRPLSQKLAVVFAGPAVNFFFGVLVFAGIFSVYGIPTKIYSTPVLAAVAASSPAEQVGLRQGDHVLAIKVATATSFTTLVTNQQLIDSINAHRGTDLFLKIERDGKDLEIRTRARTAEETPQGQGSLGIILLPQYENRQYPLWERPFRGILAGLRQSLEFGWMILSSLRGLGTTIAAGSVPKDVAGPVGIAAQVQKEGVFSNGIASALNFAALLSINLAIMNLLPIPALDGGRIVLLILEKFFKGKKFAQASQWLNTAGFVFLLSLLLLITLKDVVSLFWK